MLTRIMLNSKCKAVQAWQRYESLYLGSLEQPICTNLPGM